MSRPDFPIAQGNLLPVLDDLLLDTNGQAIDLSVPNVTVNFVMRGPGGCGRVVINRGATIIDAAGGAVRYSWQAGDTDIPGNYVASWVVTVDGLPMDVPDDSFITIKIRPKVA